MWTGYSRRQELKQPDEFIKYPRFVFIEHSVDMDAADVFERWFGHRPHVWGMPDWNSKTNEDLMPLIGGLIECSNDWSDCQDSYRLIYLYFIDANCYVHDMNSLNAFLKRADVLILSEMNVCSG